MKIFKQSQAVSTLPGKSHFLTRFPKHTKDHIQIRKLEKENQQTKEKGFEAFEEIKKLRSKLRDMEESQVDADNNFKKFSKLYQLGVIDENGECVNIDMR